MPYPPDFETASRDFDVFLDRLKLETDTTTRHQAFQIAYAVLRVFRNHLETRDALVFADALPPLLRAMFVEDWTPVDAPPPFPSRAELDREVMAIRRDHSLAGPGSIDDVARGLFACSDRSRLELALERMPVAARDFFRAGISA